MVAHEDFIAVREHHSFRRYEIAVNVSAIDGLLIDNPNFITVAGNYGVTARKALVVDRQLGRSRTPPDGYTLASHGDFPGFHSDVQGDFHYFSGQYNVEREGSLRPYCCGFSVTIPAAKNRATRSTCSPLTTPRFFILQKS